MHLVYLTFYSIPPKFFHYRQYQKFLIRKLKSIKFLLISSPPLTTVQRAAANQSKSNPPPELLIVAKGHLITSLFLFSVYVTKKTYFSSKKSITERRQPKSFIDLTDCFRSNIHFLDMLDVLLMFWVIKMPALLPAGRFFSQISRSEKQRNVGMSCMMTK